MNTKSYKIHPSWVGEALNVTVVGAGGTGSVMLGALAQMAVAMRELGHQGLNVTVFDDDTVSRANIGRQAFAPGDVGQSKVDVLVNRLNLTFGLQFNSCPYRLDPSSIDTHRAVVRDTHVWIGCVDTRQARKAIHEVYTANLNSKWSRGAVAWLDCGNLSSTGQVVLGVHQGEPGRQTPNQRYVALPCVADLFPETIDATLDASDDVPSCSLAEALTKQDLFTNRMVADFGINLLWQLLRHGHIDHHGGFINLKTGRINPIAVDPKVWSRMGYEMAQRQEPVAIEATAA